MEHARPNDENKLQTYHDKRAHATASRSDHRAAAFFDAFRTRAQQSMS